ncbi:MAG: (d)CMP kinase, partial [Clostridiales bacterium]|nr:(d)CMP kinase [Clostridiales bacterium]
MSENVYQIAIDGPSGSGKSTLAKGAAKALGIMYLDTGAMYRTCGLCAIKKGIEPKDADAVAKMLDEMDLQIKFADGIQHMILNGEDVTGSIRTPEVSRAASDISSLP